MKRCKLLGLIVIALLAVSVFTPTVSAEPGAAALLSAMMPGTGEWYNSGFSGSFPFAECIVGYICFPIHFSSVFDAVNGNADDGLRIDFWTAPQ